MRLLWLASFLAAATASAAPTASQSGVMTPPLSPRNASYTIAARLDPATRTITGSETITWRNITNRPAADLQFHLYWNAWKNTHSTFMRERALGGNEDEDRRRRPDEWARLEITAVDGRRPRSQRVEAVHRARRRQPRRRNGDVGAARRAGRAGRQRHHRGRLDGARAAHVRAHRRDRQLLLHRAVVPEARRAAGRRLELPPVPRRHRVLLRLRRLRRVADGARRLAARRHRRPARAPRQRRRHDHAPLLPGRRARLRLDDEPRLRRANRALRACAAAARSRCGCCSSPSTSARPSVTSTRRAPR